MAEAGLQSAYVIMGLVEQMRLKGLLDGSDLHAAAAILDSVQGTNPARTPEKAEALADAAVFLRGLAG